MLRPRDWLVLHSWNTGGARKWHEGDHPGELDFIQRYGLVDRDQSHSTFLDD